MAPLPLGTSSHPTDQYNLIALLTPIKLVIVGLKPSPKTWYRQHRNNEDDIAPKAVFKGALAWFPSVTSGISPTPVRASKANGHDSHIATTPMLVYSWGNTLSLIRVSESTIMQQTRNAKSGKVVNVEVGRVVFEEVRTWTAAGDVLAVQWLNVNQIVVLTPSALEVYDIRLSKFVEHVPYDAWSLVSPILSHTTNGTISYSDAITEVAHSVKVYKGKIFLLGQHELQVGTLLTWADRILSSVQNGDFLSAIELTRSYYVGEAPGNRNGLPDSPEQLKEVVGEKMRELMVASARYAFSEDRMTDATHVTADGRGVDRTSLFEGLVKTCARACIALADFDFLFEDLFQYYDDNFISGIFLLELEPFVLNSSIRQVPPRITQRLIALHEEDGHPDLAERVIWHIDPECLDINQAITLCQNYRMYDALIYVFTRAMKDYVSPVVELLGLIRRVQQFRRARNEASSPTNQLDDDAIEPVVISAYKIYPYLADTLSGLTFPSEEPLPEEEAFQAKNDVYTFLFFGRSSVWPEGEGGKLVLTADEENGVEPTYPYARLLLRFDPEAFLHTLDLAFEDAYLNDETRRVSRLVIVKILLEILSSPGLSAAEITFVNIFIARNIPKYSQFIRDLIPMSVMHSILVGLAEDPDQSTREDRQLAAEYLLSGYTPHDSDRLVALFEEAGFYRILRSWYQQESQWSPLLLTYLKDPDLSPSGVFPSIDEVLSTASRPNKGVLPQELLATITDSLLVLLRISVVSTAALLDKHQPTLHERALERLAPEADEQRFAYLRYLLGLPHEDYGVDPLRRDGPSLDVPPSLRQLYVTLHCRFDPVGIIAALSYLPSGFLDAADVIRTCEEHEVFDAVIWTMDREGDPRAALSKSEAFEKLLSTRLAEHLASTDPEAGKHIQDVISALEAVGRTTVSACLQHSHPSSAVEVPLEDIWFQLLRGQIDSVQRVAGCCSSEAFDAFEDSTSEHVKLERQTLAALRSLVQRTFTSLMSISSTKAVSFPRLFKRLVESASHSHVSKRTLYTEFRTILTGMLESFRSDGDMLVITKHLIDRDLFVTIEEFAHERVRGWAPSQGVCRACGESFLENKTSPGAEEPKPESSVPIVVSRTGAIYHSRCLPPDFHTNASNVH
ncbi:Golgi CORVET complex core vacuolar protein 8-domain-containing protein [Amylocystis lapponica]|nr:Golgi CORVET complex core vacuolar protein 8-domain-containing protein [Amylocystis lapponica]